MRGIQLAALTGEIGYFANAVVCCPTTVVYTVYCLPRPVIFLCAKNYRRIQAQKKTKNYKKKKNYFK